MKKLLQKLSILFFLFSFATFLNAQAPSGYTSVLNHNFGTSGNIKNVTDLQNNYDWGLLWGDANPNNPWANPAEWQKYTTLTSNNYAFASNHLKIIARFNNDLNGNGTPDYAGGSDQTGTNREITSGCLRSKNTYKPTASKSYYFETRMKIPSGKALWPAFWLYRKKGGTNAEIDIVEVVNNQWDSSKAPNWTPLAYHNNVHISNSGDNAFASPKGNSLSSGYHTWACEWTSTQVKFYLDNNLIRTVSYPINNPNTGWGDSNPANVLINLAAGGGWPGPADDINAFPATLEVDYLRIYQKTSSGGSDEITSVSGPASISTGQSVTVAVDYSASTNRKIVSLLQLGESPWTSTWGGQTATASQNVSAGSGTVNLTFTIPNGVPVGSNYQYQNYITTTNGGWAQKLHNGRQYPITVSNGGGGTGYKYLKYTVTNAFNHKMIELSWLAGSTNYPQTNLTSNTSGSGIAVSGSFGNDSYKAFDGDLSGPNGLWIGDQTPKHILLDFGSSKVSPTKIRIQKKSWSDLKGFKCEGSNDGSNWTVLLNNTTSTGDWTDRTFTFSGTALKSTLSTTESELTLDKSLVHPNPTDGLFNLDFSSTYIGEVSIKIFTFDGREIENMTLQKRDGAFAHQIDLLNQASGTYIIQLKAGEHRSSHQVIKN